MDTLPPPNIIEAEKLSKKTILFGALTLAVSVAFMIVAITVWFYALHNADFEQQFSGGNGTAAYFLLLALFTGLMITLYFYILTFHREVASNPGRIGALFTILVLCFTVCLFLEPLGAPAMPLTLSVVLICLLVDAKLAPITTVYLGVSLVLTLVCIGEVDGEKAIREAVYTAVALAVSGFFTMWLMRYRLTRLRLILFSSLAGLVNIPIFLFVFLINQPAPGTYLGGLAWAPVGILGVAAITLLVQPLLDRIFNLVSISRLIELCDINHPLLARLYSEAPGTYHHSATVATLSETCAAAIGENRYLARACAYFHDVGKLDAADFFSENQSAGTNPHDQLGPEVSCDIIRSHTKKGMELCRRFRIPDDIAQITIEHHGTLPVSYFYSKAAELYDGKLPDVDEFRYSGHLPQTKISAIVMICDGSEAAVRAAEKGKPDPEAVSARVAQIIEMRRAANQFDECPLTFYDLQIIRESIVNSICGLKHERVRYDSKKY
ncbi:MAG: HDIG domain-containing protein [Clostridiales bacterium]|jgi:putative nucleotidyltransferase with HDIG domain|nr:HDIG domain-containing protein [Clostridiales bacterium]